MIRKAQKTRKYSAPNSKETSLALERNICSVVFDVRVQELEGINELIETCDAAAEPLYFEI